VRALDKGRLQLRSLLRRRSVEGELDRELRFHLDQLAEEKIVAGAPRDEARRLALREMGGITQLQEECRDMRRVSFVDDLLRDLRYAGRNLQGNPGFAALAILIMARYWCQYRCLQHREHSAFEAAFVPRSGPDCDAQQSLDDRRRARSVIRKVDLDS
jgi:hypothetical protein